MTKLKNIFEVFDDIIGKKEDIENSLFKYGSSAEHYYYCFLYNIEENERPYYFKWSNNKAILAKHNTHDNEWYIFVGVLAPEEEKILILKEFLDFVFEKGAKKVWCEFETSFRKKVIAAFKDSEYKVNNINYTLIWPVFDMSKWNGDKMEGKEWKDIRYYWNKFFKDHKVEFREFRSEDKETLKEIVYRWKKERNGKDKTYIHYYLNAINNDFKGYETMVMVVDNKIAGITAGYKLSNKDYYYSSIGITTKEFERAGEISNMADLINLKKKGYAMVDFGGGEKNLTLFKRKFMPTRYYKTHVFSIVKKTL